MELVSRESVFEVITNLRSFRTCKSEVIPRKVLGKLIEAGRHTPSPGNVQSLEFIVVEDDAKKDSLAQITGDRRVYEAPSVVIIIADTDRLARRVGEDLSLESGSAEAAISAQNMRLAAAEEDIASCWLTGFDEATVSDNFAIPDEKSPMGVVALCYGDSYQDEQKSFGISDVVYYDEYEQQIRNFFDKMEWKGVREYRNAPDRRRKTLSEKIREKLNNIL